MWTKRTRTRVTAVGIVLVVFGAAGFSLRLFQQTMNGRGTEPYTSGTGVHLIPIGVLVTFSILAAIGLVGLARAWLDRRVRGNAKGAAEDPGIMIWSSTVSPPSSAPSNPRLERTGRRTAHHGRATRAAGRSTAGS